MNEINIFEIKRSNRRTISLEITRDGNLLVKAPYLIPKILINKFVEQKKDWIIKHLKKFNHGSTKKKDYLDGEKFFFLGRTYFLHISNYKEIFFSDNGFLCFPFILKFRIIKELEIFYKKKAKEIICERVSINAKAMNLNFGSIMFSDTKSKWGTCTHRNNLQFNWRLVMAPLEVVDYVVVHELSHVIYKNHSHNFWNNVQLYKPAYKQHKKWLFQNSHSLVI